MSNRKRKKDYLDSWIFYALIDFNGGNSCLSFIGLYLLARYIKIYSPSFSAKSAKHDVLLYCMFTVFSATASYCLASNGIFLQDRFYMYNSPFVILQALFFLLFFSKLKIKYSASINFVAISCLAVYLFQCSPFMSLYGENIGRWFIEENTLHFVLYVSLMIFMVYFMAILLDKGRLFMWNAIVYVCERMGRRVVAQVSWNDYKKNIVYNVATFWGKCISSILYYWHSLVIFRLIY